jgi:hypothetical protein
LRASPIVSFLGLFVTAVVITVVTFSVMFATYASIVAISALRNPFIVRDHIGHSGAFG